MKPRKAKAAMRTGGREVRAAGRGALARPAALLSSAHAWTKAGCPNGEPSGLVASPDIIARFRDPSRSGACFGNDDPSLAQIGGIAVFNSAYRGIEGGRSPGRHRDHVDVVQESDDAVVGIERFRRLLKGIVLSKGEKCGGEGILLLFCASTRANYLLRMLPPHCTADYSRDHDRAVVSCLRTLLYGEDAPALPDDALATAQLPLGLGGLGLRSAASGAPAAYWASWQDAFPALLQRFPDDAARLRASLSAPHAGMPPGLAAACAAAAHVRASGFPVPDWDVAAAPSAPPPPAHGDSHLRGWQRAAVAACDERALETHLSHLNPASRALLLSQAGPHSGRALTALPTSAAVALPPEHLRVPLAPRVCRCRGRLDPLGDHRSACATSGVLASRALPHEHAVARVCREGGTRVARNVRVADLNIDVPVSDARCIEVVAHGLPFWHGAQLALDAIIVSPVTRAGEPQPGADTRLPPPLRAAACAGWVQRWSGILAVAAMRAFAASLLELPPGGDDCEAGVVPDLHEVLAAGGSGPLLASRLPAS